MSFSADDRDRRFQIQLRMQNPVSCSQDTLHKSLKLSSRRLDSLISPAGV